MHLCARSQALPNLAKRHGVCSAGFILPSTLVCKNPQILPAMPQRLVFIGLLLLTAINGFTADERDPYRELRTTIQKRDATKRKVPVIPPAGQKLSRSFFCDATRHAEAINRYVTNLPAS